MKTTSLPWKLVLFAIPLSFLSLLLVVAQTNPHLTLPPAAAQTGGASEPTKPCFNCGGTGNIKCRACNNGQMECPGNCLKLSKGTWQHLDVAGHDKSELWQKFYASDGRKWGAWNQHHIGEVIEMQNGAPVNVGKCKICGGTTHVPCTTCNGTGMIICDICDGKKAVPQSWTAFNNPKLKNRPNAIVLKDGRIIFGKITMSSQTALWIKTETGETINIDRDQVKEMPPDAK